MKQKFFLLFAVLALVVILIGLNAASYVQKEKVPDSEAQPNRSTFNSGATGTRALHDLLAATGKRVSRRQEPIGPEFEEYDSTGLDTFVIIGPVRRELGEEEIRHVLAWVSAGGQLVLIDREPDSEFLTTSSWWEIGVNEGRNAVSATERDYLTVSVDPANQGQMTARTSAVRPVQPSIFNAQVNGVQPSKFANSIRITRVPGQPEEDGTDDPGIGASGSEEDNAELPNLTNLAPVVHLANDDKNLLADFPFGAGRIVLLTDPYVVANGGIDLADNAQVALNVIGSRTGPIAFDEYHQGFGADDNRLLSYFSGTPVVAIFLQFTALIALVIFSRGRRFARPVPAESEDRLSKLEYVAAMAQLQSRTKAFDLAIENIYTDFRRRVSRFFSVDNFTVSKESLAGMVAKRLGMQAEEVVDLMQRCEDIMHGEQTRRGTVLELVRRLREIEEALGLERGRNARHL
ncbi:MAG: DUF4350 domain-containing protein [Acidobacteriota bacterium]|nr:MAG: DUF4350 domain-containing protein [Acidobacteriota bacterium]